MSDAQTPNGGAFDWDDAKAASNVRKHGVSFVEAQSIFRDAFGMTQYDPRHSELEDRFITIGLSFQGRLLVVAHTDHELDIRIISARKATSKEADAYAQNRENRSI